MIRKSITPDIARDRIERQCGKAERCSYEMKRKLLSWGIDEHTAAEIIEGLIEEKYIDDARYARAFVRDKYRFQRWGRRRIVTELRMRHIDRDLIENALEEIDEKEYKACAQSLLKAKARALGDDAYSFDGRKKLLRLGMSRGYEPDLIMQIIRSGFFDED